MKIISRYSDSFSSCLTQNSFQSRAEIRRLTKLLNEIPSRRSSQMAELSELEENLRESTGEEPSDTESR